MLEWVWVDHPRVRDVFVDDIRTGTTNQLLIVSAGRHTFDLGKPVTYAPTRRMVTVTATTPATPRVIEFDET
jgi:hypothetical protein